MKWQDRDRLFAIANKINRYRTETNTATLRERQMRKEKGVYKETMVLVDNTTNEEKVYIMVRKHMKEHKVDFDTACRQISYKISEKIRKGVAV